MPTRQPAGPTRSTGTRCSRRTGVASVLSCNFELANQLAERAIELGEDDARWLYAATLDRYLTSQGKPQKYGTQYQNVDGKWVLLPVDPATTDEERAEYRVPPLQEPQQFSVPLPVIKK